MKEYRIKPLNKWRGLTEADILTYNPNTNLFELHYKDESMSDDVHMNSTLSISLSPSYIERHMLNFEDMDGYWFVGNGKNEPEEYKDEPDLEAPKPMNEEQSELDQLRDMLKDLEREVKQLTAETKPSAKTIKKKK